ncbi:phage tail protein [Microbulbifer sp. THAF38]|uniref:phage tail protein n=1 Tax=Microbulbifer sp. THAF38 TaxID=2587856 RepID=UPI001267A844|nr:phage tail protein [Microbulbifer sp. THAF38]QFT56589.1 Phage P2 GpU [Microbulbifer sp. THAF38]
MNRNSDSVNNRGSAYASQPTETQNAETMLKIGDFPFAINTCGYDQLRQAWKFNWQNSNRPQGYPQLQFTGQGTRDINLSGKIYPLEFGKPNQLQEMAAIAAKGKPLRLMSGRGATMGYWAITNIERTDKDPFSDGVARCVEFSISLTYYGAKYGH